MGYFMEYMSKGFTFEGLELERKKQLKTIRTLTKLDVLVYAADKQKPDSEINSPDFVMIKDTLSNLSGEGLFLILETPGGYGEVAEDIVNLIRHKYKHLSVCVPGSAKSSGTIIAMAGDEILMEPSSALGPIDGQIRWGGKIFSADAFLEGLEKIKREVADNANKLNMAYVPILQNISPGEIQHAQNAQDFSKKLVADWLANYKFKNWNTHSSTGKPVTAEEKQARAEEIANRLRNQKVWMTHGRSIKIKDFEEMRLQIRDYSKEPELAEALGRYYALLLMTLGANVVKVFETCDSQIYVNLAPVQQQTQSDPKTAPSAIFKLPCQKCGDIQMVQANLEPGVPLQPGAIPFPKSNKVKCLKCKSEADVSERRRQIEAQSGKKVVYG